MRKPQENQAKSRKDDFFISKKQSSRPDNQSTGLHLFKNPSPSFSKQSSTNSDSFFVSPLEKQQIPQEKEAKKNSKQRFKPMKVEAVKRKRCAENERPKKKFDKKKWRLQKYSKKYKLQQWEEKRKKAVLHEYYKQVKDDEPKLDINKIYYRYEDEDGQGVPQLDDKQKENENENNLNRDLTQETQTSDTHTQGHSSDLYAEANNTQTKKRKAFKKAHLEYQRLQNEKKRKKEELQRQKVEKAEALKQYKQKKVEKYQKLNKKNKKGQPVMKYRMEMLLEQIQKSVQ